jgi:cytochrome c553
MKGWQRHRQIPACGRPACDYTLDQFRLYATGKRTNGARVMKAVAERMSEEETRAVAEYMASMP